MSDFSGRLVSFGIGKESVRGTSVAPTYWAQQLEADFQNKVEKIFNESVFGVLDKNTAAEIVKEWSAGKISGKVLDKQFGIILAAAFGNAPSSVAKSAPNATVYDHTFAQNQTNTGLSFTLVRKDANSNKRYALAMLAKLEVTVVVGEFVQFTSEWLGKKGVTGSDTPAYTLENEFKPKYATVKLATNVAGLGAATAVPVRSIKFTVERKINPYFVAGSNEPGEIFNEEVEVTGEIVLRYTDQTYENLWANNTAQALLIDLQNTDVTIGTSANPGVKFTFPKVILADWGIDPKRADMVEQTIGFKALYDVSSTSTWSAVLTNLVTSY